MAVPIVESVASTQASSASTLTITKPSGVVSGDLLVAFVSGTNAEGFGTVPAFSGPSGWTQRAEFSSSFTSGVGETLSLWTKVASGSEPSNYTWTNTGTPASIHLAGGIARISGQHASDFWHKLATDTVNNSSSTTFAATGVTTTVDDCLILRVCANERAQNATPVIPSGYTSMWSQVSASSQRNENVAGRSSQETAGATGTATWTGLSGGGNTDFLFATVAIAAAVAGAPTQNAVFFGQAL